MAGYWNLLDGAAMTEETMLDLERRTEAKFTAALDSILAKMTDPSRRKCFQSTRIVSPQDDRFVQQIYCERVYGHTGHHSAGELSWPDRPRKEQLP
jgi:hypothetical protein